MPSPVVARFASGCCCGAGARGVGQGRMTEPASFGSDLARSLAPGAGVGGAACAWMKVFCTTQPLSRPPLDGVVHGARLLWGVASTNTPPLSSSSGQRSFGLRWLGVRRPSSDKQPRLSRRSRGTFTGVDSSVAEERTAARRSGVPVDDGAGLAGGCRPMALPLAAEPLSAVDSAAESHNLAPRGTTPKAAEATSASASTAEERLVPMSFGRECERWRAPGIGVAGGPAAWMKVFCTCHRTAGERAGADGGVANDSSRLWATAALLAAGPVPPYGMAPDGQMCATAP
mmetsp:Transcript_22371/g.64155  ORF Transcript_22371/g.64155 Transcript_22371/m.64155 type:complete len:287 (+) Transcript_22371:766-1626(+)